MGAICPRCRTVPATTVTIGSSTFCASCLAGVEALLVAHVPPVAQAPAQAESAPPSPASPAPDPSEA